MWKSDRLAADLDLHGGRMFIGGEWVAPASDDQLEVISACTEETLARVPAACAADVDRAVAAATFYALVASRKLSGDLC